MFGGTVVLEQNTQGQEDSEASHHVPSETSVSCGVVALETEKPPLSRMEASSSESSESVIDSARAVFFTSTCTG